MDLLSTSPAHCPGLIRFESDLVIEYADARSAEILSDANLVGKRIDQRIPGIRFVVDPEEVDSRLTHIDGKCIHAVSVPVRESGRLLNLLLVQEYPWMDAEIASRHASAEQITSVLEHIHENTSVIDARGFILSVSKSWEKTNGLRRDQVVGKHMSSLERAGVFTPSVTLQALNQRKKVSIVQRNQQGERILCTGVPIFDEHGGIEYVVGYDSWDVSNYLELKEHYQKMRALMDHYSEEIRIKEIGDSVLVSKSPEMQKVLRTVVKVAQVNANVLITGESGVGKNMIARIIHDNSPCSRGPFIDINCGAIPENLIESELFGYDRGAFTGARNDGKAGLIELSHNGTLFLDEVGELPLGVQVKLLKAIEERTLTRVGGTRAIPVNFRLVAATNRDLGAMVKTGRFREDLYYRLNVVPVQIPPLRSRPEDLLALIMRFTHEMNERYGKNASLSREAVDALMAYSWPGNVRELRNVIERAIITSEDDVITSASISDHGVDHAPSEEPEALNLKNALERYEKQLVLKAYEKHKTTVGVGRALGISQPSAVRKIRKYLGGYSTLNSAIRK